SGICSTPIRCRKARERTIMEEMERLLIMATLASGSPAVRVTANEKLRLFLTLVVVSAGVWLTIYIGNDWFTHQLLPVTGLSESAGDAFGGTLIAVMSFFAQRVVAVLLYR